MPAAVIAEVLALLTREPGRPRLTWYGDDGERVELSGAVLENWVNKTTNLLVEEFDAGPGTRVLLDLPGHWRTVVWAAAVWRAGGCVVTPDGGPGDVVVTDRPDQHPGARTLVVVALPALARRFDGTLPPGALDAAGAVMTYGDALGWLPPVDLDQPAIDDGTTLAHRDLLAAATTDGNPGDRVLRGAGERIDRTGLLTVLGDLAAAGSVVLTSAPQSQHLRSDDERRTRLVADERVTADRLG